MLSCSGCASGAAGCGDGESPRQDKVLFSAVVTRLGISILSGHRGASEVPLVRKFDLAMAWAVDDTGPLNEDPRGPVDSHRGI
jgi:hypothetical protein